MRALLPGIGFGGYLLRARFKRGAKAGGLRRHWGGVSGLVLLWRYALNGVVFGVPPDCGR